MNWPQIPIDTNKGYDLCFGCGQNNPIGLKLNFQWDGKTARAEFIPTKFYQGWSGLLHGGIITTILDEAMGYAASSEGVNCVTASIEARFRRPASIDEPLIITSSITRKTRKLVETKAVIFLKDGTIIAEGRAKQFVVNAKSDSINNKEGET